MSDQTSEVPRPPDTAPDITAPLPLRPRTSLGPGQVALAFLAVAAGAFLVGIALGAMDGGRPEGTVLAEARVGPQGKTIRFDGGAVVFPRGAVTRQVRIVVTRTEDDEPAYRFEPSDVTFRRPVEIRLRLPDGARNGAVVSRHDGSTILFGGDVGAGTVSVEVRDFTFEREPS